MKRRYKPRHKWSELIDNPFTEQQKCVQCGLFRFKALRSWMYSENEITRENPFVDSIANLGCIIQEKIIENG